MKNKIIILITLVISQYSISQIMTINQYSTYVESGNDLPTDILEIRDINGTFHPYLGEWQAQYNGNTIKLVVTESTYTYEDGLILDQIVTRFEIKDSNGNIIESTMSLPDNSNHMIIFNFISHKGNLHSSFSEQNDCGIVERIYYTLHWIPGSLNPTSMTFFAIKNEYSDKGEGPNCPNGHTPSTFPLNQDIIFTKI